MISSQLETPMAGAPPRSTKQDVDASILPPSAMPQPRIRLEVGLGVLERVVYGQGLHKQRERMVLEGDKLKLGGRKEAGIVVRGRQGYRGHEGSGPEFSDSEWTGRIC